MIGKEIIMKSLFLVMLFSLISFAEININFDKIKNIPENNVTTSIIIEKIKK